jgi:hypothetical protein
MLYRLIAFAHPRPSNAKILPPCASSLDAPVMHMGAYALGQVPYPIVILQSISEGFTWGVPDDKME